MAKKTYNQKLNSGKLEVSEVTDECAVKMGGKLMLVATPLEYDVIMKQVPQGKIITSDKINTYLAKKHKADWTCQMTAGIFINIAANASAERKGENETPYWRTLKKCGELNEKYPGGIDGQKVMLEIEGHKIVAKGKKLFVEDYQAKEWIIQ